MKLKPLALGLTLGILSAIAIAFVTYYPEFTSYGSGMRELLVDSYPYYDYSVWYKVLAGVGLGFLDGFIGGIIIAWVYNLVGGSSE